jgi:hypothetical protein
MKEEVSNSTQQFTDTLSHKSLQTNVYNLLSYNISYSQLQRDVDINWESKLVGQNQWIRKSVLLVEKVQYAFHTKLNLKCNCFSVVY